VTPTTRFRPHERIRDPGDFRRAFERRRSASDTLLIVYAIENGRDFPRLGISIGKKRVRKASARNRIKRLIREAFRLSKPELPAGIDLIVVPRGVPLSLAQALRSLPELARAASRRLGPPRPQPSP
jgi:ribonuclease P protein component